MLDTPAHEGVERRRAAALGAVMGVISGGRTVTEVARDWGRELADDA